MKRIRHWVAFLTLGSTTLAGCATAPGKPARDSQFVTPSEVMNFDTLYEQNCAGCHGTEGRGGATIALANPVYLAIADDNAIRMPIANGVRGTSMPAFAASAGGLLTEKQIDVLVREIRTRWSRPSEIAGITPPSYEGRLTGDFQRGAATYKTYCVSCHGPDGAGGTKGSAITNDSFLALVSAQGLRTMIIAGRPELGAPDWRGYVSGKPMSDQEVADVVAWLASHRVQSPGQPYSTSNIKQHQESDHVE